MSSLYAQMPVYLLVGLPIVSHINIYRAPITVNTIQRCSGSPGKRKLGGL